MAIDVSKLQPADLAKLAQEAKKGKPGRPAVEKAIKDLRALDKDAVALAEAAKANPNV
jgi:transcription elongation GreA/GreB family factor